MIAATGHLDDFLVLEFLDMGGSDLTLTKGADAKLARVILAPGKELTRLLLDSDRVIVAASNLCRFKSNYLFRNTKMALRLNHLLGRLL